MKYRSRSDIVGLILEAANGKQLVVVPHALALEVNGIKIITGTTTRIEETLLPDKMKNEMKSCLFHSL